MNQKKRDLSEWEKSECAALKAAIEEYNRARPKNERITQEQAGAALGMNQGSFSNYLNGRLAINLDFALKVSRLFDIPVEKFSKRLAQDIEDISSTGNKLPEVEHFLPRSLYIRDEYIRESPPKITIVKALQDEFETPGNLNILSAEMNAMRSPSRSALMREESASQVRLRHLIKKLQSAVEHDLITEKDFDLLESMLDRLMDMGAPYQRESNEHLEKH